MYPYIVYEHTHTHCHTLKPQKPPQGIKIDDIEVDPDAPALPPPHSPPSPEPLPAYQ